jgi:hypothetical protein
MLVNFARARGIFLDHLVPALQAIEPAFSLLSRYDAEESGTVVDGEDAADVFLGDEKLFASREAALAKRSGGAAQARLTRADGSQMSLAASKKYSALHADNQQWEDRQLMASGVVRRTEQDLEIDNEEENKAILLVHGTDHRAATAPHGPVVGGRLHKLDAWHPTTRATHRNYRHWNEFLLELRRINFSCTYYHRDV